MSLVQRVAWCVTSGRRWGCCLGQSDVVGWEVVVRRGLCGDCRKGVTDGYQVLDVAQVGWRTAVRDQEAVPEAWPLSRLKPGLCWGPR